MVQFRDGSSLSFESFLQDVESGQVRTEHLDGDDSVQPGIARFVDFAHAACANAHLQFEITEGLPNQRFTALPRRIPVGKRFALSACAG
jgi:hypothetical protein